DHCFSVGDSVPDRLDWRFGQPGSLARMGLVCSHVNLSVDYFDCLSDRRSYHACWRSAIFTIYAASGLPSATTGLSSAAAKLPSAAAKLPSAATGLSSAAAKLPSATAGPSSAVG